MTGGERGPDEGQASSRRWRGRELSLRGAAPALRGPAGALVPAGDELPARGRLTMSARPLRTASWAGLPDSVAQRMDELAGPRIEWWAALLPGSPRRARAVVLGTAGAVFAEPGSGNRNDYLITCYVLDPKTLVRVQVVSRPEAPRPRLGRWAGHGGSGPAGQEGTPDEPTDGGPGGDTQPGPWIEGLPADAARVLDTIPPRAADLLTAPFRQAGVLRADYHYEGNDTRLDVFGLVLAGRQDLTLATGSRLIPAGHTARTAHWGLTCARARVAERVTE